MLAVTASWAQLATIAMGALAGVLWCRAPEGIEAGRLELPVSRRIGIAALGAFLLLLVALPLARSLHPTQAVALVDACYRSGALVFGGGHVVLPLLRQAFVGTGWVTDEVFLNGYGAAQALPGPLFSFAAYLGASVRPAPHGWAGAALGLAALYLPGMLILIGALPFWQTFSRQANARAALRGVNAAVVGLLAAALYNPVWTNSVHAPADAGVVLIGFLMLMVWRAPPLLVVACGALAGLSLTRFVP
jgi:chromate transporter